MTQPPHMPADLLLRVRGLSKHYSVGGGRTGGRTGEMMKALDDVSFDLKRGETLGVVGESGSGKTTASRAVLRATRPPARYCSKITAASSTWPRSRRGSLSHCGPKCR